MPFILALFCSPLVPDVLGDKRGEVRRHDHSARDAETPKDFGTACCHFTFGKLRAQMGRHWIQRDW